MSGSNIIEYTIAILVASGISTLAVTGIFKLIGSTISKGIVEKFKASLQHELESYKTKLKKSEFIFQKEYEAASEFISMKRGFFPPYRYPEMEWDDVCEETAQDFDKVEKQVGAFIAKHGAILSRDTLDALSHVEGLAAKNKFQGRGPEPSYEAIKAAEQLWKRLDEIEEKLRQVVHSQSSA